MKRCSWVDEKSQIYIKYHDEEWGVPKFNDRELFELLILEGFQAGLSWITILKKRENFRLAFDNFDALKVSQYSTKKTEELLKNDGIIRCRKKIEAAINNAKIFLNIQSEFGTFAKYIWSFTDNKIIKNTNDNFVVSSPLSDRISKDLKQRGMKYTGTIIIYSYLQAIGVINDHETTCICYKK